MTDTMTDTRPGSEHEQHKHRLGGAHPTNPWDAEIDVTLTSDGTPPQFSIATCLPVDPSGNIIFNNAGRPGFRLTFRLYDDTNGGNGSGYTFPQGANKADAIWSEIEANGCPSSGVWNVFPTSSIVVQDSGMTLVVHNPNPCPAQGLFRYTLNVTKTGAPPYLALDPGGSNQNGSTSRW